MHVHVVVTSFENGEPETVIHKGWADEATVEARQSADVEKFGKDNGFGFGNDYLEELWSRVNGSLAEDDGHLFIDAAVAGLYMSDADFKNIGCVLYSVGDDRHAAVCIKSS